jgi:ribosomal protein S8
MKNMKARTDYIRIAAGFIFTAVFIAHIGCASVTTAYLTTPIPHEEYIIVTGEGATWHEAVDKAIRKSVDKFGVDIKAEEIVINRKLANETILIDKNGWVTEYEILNEEEKDGKISVTLRVLLIAKEDIDDRKKIKQANQQVVGVVNTVGGMVGDIGGGVLAVPFKVVTDALKRFKNELKKDIEGIYK